ncbi:MULTISPECIES: hypothetical protein [Pseudoalteromonas]|uniref:hypothetical protein n=1 Tax=Pseudoalteromonas TaxID=53246 RepID=UPI001601BF39|nr:MULTISPECIES: hypothetical protein [Pseudoalteromonas]MBB1303299.1 hypothetical protein [Pseudoalteromonas sp. SR44-8]
MPPRFEMYSGVCAPASSTPTGFNVYLGVKLLVGEWLATAIFNIVSVFSRQQA